MAYLAVHAHTPPSEFSNMDPGDTRAFHEAVAEIVDERDEMFLALAKLVASSRLAL